MAERSERSRLLAEERSMPRYFFHLVKGSKIVARDVTGQVCANDQAAQAGATGRWVQYFEQPPIGSVEALSHSGSE